MSAGRDRQNVTLDDIPRDLTLVQRVPVEDIRRLFYEASSVHAALTARIAELQLTTTRSEPSGEDRLLNVAEAAKRLGLKENYLYRNAHKYPFTYRPAPGQLRFSSHGIDAYIRSLLR